MMDEQMVTLEMSNKELNRMMKIVDIVDNHFEDGEINNAFDMVNELEEMGEL